MLKQIIIKEKFKIENNKPFAIAEGLINGKREINGCEVRKLLGSEIPILEKALNELKQQVEDKQRELSELLKIDNQLTALGYCKISRPVYKKIDGIVIKDALGSPIIESRTHECDCPNKEV